MLWLWILGGLAALLILVCLLRLQLLADFDETASLVLRIGPVPIRLLPQKTAKQTQEASAPKQETFSGLGEKLKRLPKPSATDIADAYRTLKPVMLRALRHTRKGLRIDPLELSVILGGRTDPAQTAEYYGYARAAVWTTMPALEQLLVIPDPHIHIDMDFDAETVQVRGRFGIGMRIGTLILLGIEISVPTLIWFLKYLRRRKAEQTIHQQPVDSPAA